MDEIDRAAKLEQLQHDIALQNQVAQIRGHLPSRDVCIDCDWPIEAVRQRLGGAERCAECQGYYVQEQHQKGFVSND